MVGGVTNTPSMKLPKIIGSEAQIKWASEKLEILARSLTNFLVYRQANGTPKEVCEKIAAIFEGATLNASDVIEEYRNLAIVMNCDTKAEQIYTESAMKDLIIFIKSKKI